jgi:hypothetical protein
LTLLFISAYYAATMKWKAVIVLLAIALSIVVPPSLPFLSDHGAMAAIGTLDVCHSAIPALSSNGDMPCVNECFCRPLPVGQYTIAEPVNPLLKPSAISFQDERPPRH